MRIIRRRITMNQLQPKKPVFKVNPRPTAPKPPEPEESALDVTEVHEAVTQVIDQLLSVFPERREVIRGSVAAVLAGEHVLLLGPPGTAKSALARAIARSFTGSYFERLLTKFSTPEELFGPISLKGLEQDQYVRIVDGKLPTTQFAFIDEIFKANSSILNSLLALINERIFHNDTTLDCPLVTMFGASNELPEGKELEALFDRFLLRFNVDYLVQPSNFRAILTAPDPSSGVQLTMEQLQAAQEAVLAVTVSDQTLDSLTDLRSACKAEGIICSDRRWKKVLKLAQANAFLFGENETSPEDLAICTDSLWREVKERIKVSKIVGNLCDPVGSKALEILDAARESAQNIAALRFKDRKEYTKQGTSVLEDFREQLTRLENLSHKAGKRGKAVVAEATTKIQSMHDQISKVVMEQLGLSGPKK
jgi:MoxR-like ATPase